MEVAAIEDIPEFRDADCLWHTEVLSLLEQKRDMEDELPSNSLAASIIQKTHTYASRFSKLREQASIQEMKDTLARRFKLKPYEIAALANLSPDTAEEAKAVVLSLAERDDGEVEEILKEING